MRKLTQTDIAKRPGESPTCSGVVEARLGPRCESKRKRNRRQRWTQKPKEVRSAAPKWGAALAAESIPASNRETSQHSGSSANRRQLFHRFVFCAAAQVTT